MAQILWKIAAQSLPMLAGALGGVLAISNPAVYKAFCNGFAGLI